MAREFHLSVVAPDRSVVEEPVVSLIAPGSEGYFGVLVGHPPFIAALKPGLLEYADVSNNRHYVYLGGGFIDVREQKVTVLADEAQRAQEIDIQHAERELDSARRALRGESSEMPADIAVEEVEKAMSRIRAARAAR